MPIHTFFRHSHTTSCRKLKQCLQLIPLLVLDQTIADPVSALGIPSAIRGLLNLTAHAIKGLHTLHSSYNGATDTLRLITDNCLLLDLAVKQLKSWIKSMTAEESAELRLKDLEKALAGFMPAM